MRFKIKTKTKNQNKLKNNTCTEILFAAYDSLEK